MTLKFKIRIKKIVKLSLACLLMTFISSCETKEISVDLQVNEYEKFVSEMKSKGFNTGNILVYENGEIIYKSSNGLRSIDPIDSLTLNSQFRLASVSKQFTGMAIMKLKQAGKLNYDQKVNTILTDFPYENITIKHLLHHTSGLADYEEILEENFIPNDSTKQYILGNNEILNIFYKAKPELIFEPGEQWEYSNTGYMTLATIVEKISNQHFREFLKENIFNPIEMNNTTLYKYQIKPDPNMPNRVYGYGKTLDQKDYILNDYDIVNGVRGDGGIYSTLNDLYKWNMALVNYEIIPKEYLDEAWSSGTLNNGEITGYGFGWFLPKDTTLPKTAFHSGGWVGFGTYLYNEIETKSGYIVLTNDSWESLVYITRAIDSIRIGASYELQKGSITKGMTKEMFSKNIDAAIDYYHQMKHDSANYQVDESQLNYLGYILLNNEKNDEALAIFKLNMEEYPSSANAHDSYGDALLLKGDSLKALEQFKICQKMDTSLIYTKEKILMLEPKLNN